MQEILNYALNLRVKNRKDMISSDDRGSKEKKVREAFSVVGSSVNGLDIELYEFFSSNRLKGKDDNYVLFVGGIHGGYEWNTILLAYKIIDLIKTDRRFLPENVSVGIIPSANPDGVKRLVNTNFIEFLAEVFFKRKFTKRGRLNSNEVDLNRNFDCNWQPKSKWGSQVVSGGSKPFSEPEVVAIRDVVFGKSPDAVIFWHSAVGAVYGSECNDGILQGTLDIMSAYSKCSGYRIVDSFDHYKITGDAEGWLASIGIPSITVELKTYDSIELERNLRGVKAVLECMERQ